MNLDRKIFLVFLIGVILFTIFSFCAPANEAFTILMWVSVGGMWIFNLKAIEKEREDKS